MRFCTDCGGTLNLFETNEEGICASCRRKNDKTTAPVAVHPLEVEDLADAILCFEDNKLVLKAQEGWILWSAAITEKNNLATVLKRARRIHEIRKKRAKN